MQILNRITNIQLYVFLDCFAHNPKLSVIIPFDPHKSFQFVLKINHFYEIH